MHKKEAKPPSKDVFPILVRDALVNSNRIGPKRYWVIGIEHSTRLVEQTYVVMVLAVRVLPADMSSEHGMFQLLTLFHVVIQ